MSRLGCFFLVLLWHNTGFSWNAIGHQIVAQIAYDNLTPQAKRYCDLYNSAFNKISFSTNFVKSSVWMDQIKSRNIHEYDHWHYIDIPFSPDGTALPTIASDNALKALNDSIDTLASSRRSNREKGFSLRVLIHVTGDIHQPLHASTRVTKKLPDGDRGGNLFRLKNLDFTKNLHQYWDGGAGLFLHKKKAYVKRKAHQLEKKWPCSEMNGNLNPQYWIDESHELALKQVYNLKPYSKPSRQYRKNARGTIEKQVAAAGCRLAQTLNRIF